MGHVCAGVLGSRSDVEVSIFSGHPDLWGDVVSVSDPDGKRFEGRIKRVSSDPAEVVAGQDIILLCLPGFLIEKCLRDIEPYVGEAAVGTVVSSTGFFFFAHDVLGDTCRLFGFQRVPFIARVVEYGKSARLLGYKSSLAVAVENVVNKEELRALLSELFLTPVSLLGSFYEAALTNSNPILHTGRLYTMFKGREDEVFDHNILFYKEWTDEASQKLVDMDAEFFQLLDSLGVHSIPTLLDYYESSDAASLTRKISSIPAFQTITSPMIETDRGWKADFRSRYFTEDFPFGLRWIKELSVKQGIDTPVIDEVFTWGMERIHYLRNGLFSLSLQL